MPYRSSAALRLAFATRQGFVNSHLLRMAWRFGELRVLLIVDVIVDQYIDCMPPEISQDDGSVVLRPSKEARFLGGAGIVAANARALGAEVTFPTVTARDEAASFAVETHDASCVDHA